MIPYGLALILVMFGVAALVAVAWKPYSEIRSRSSRPGVDRAETSPEIDRLTSRDRPHCDACRYERERAKLARSRVQRHGAMEGARGPSHRERDHEFRRGQLIHTPSTGSIE
jgi:hypothetical protein